MCQNLFSGMKIMGAIGLLILWYHLFFLKKIELNLMSVKVAKEI